MSEEEETEVYNRKEYFQQGKYYSTATFTRVEENGIWFYGNHRYYTSKPLEYVGCFLKIKEPGVLLFIDDDGKEIEVEFSYRNYEACFLETNAPWDYVLK